MRGNLLASGHPISLSKLDYPLLLAPFLDRLWRRKDHCYAVSWASARLLAFAKGITMDSNRDAAHLIDNSDEFTVAMGSNNDARPVHGPRLGVFSSREPSGEK